MDCNEKKSKKATKDYHVYVGPHDDEAQLVAMSQYWDWREMDAQQAEIVAAIEARSQGGD